MDSQKKEEIQKETESAKDIQEELDLYKMMNDDKYKYSSYYERAMAVSTGLFYFKIKKLIRKLIRRFKKDK